MLSSLMFHVKHQGTNVINLYYITQFVDYVQQAWDQGTGPLSHVYPGPLISNGTGGYLWKYAEPLDGTYLKQIDHCYNDYGTGSAGNGGRERWMIQALQTGETSINLVNR